MLRRRSSANPATQSSGGSMSSMAELNVTPLLDLAFVLLIIFMITAPLLEQSAGLIIPTSNASNEAVDPSNVDVVNVTVDREIQLGEQTLTMDGLSSTMEQRFAANPALAVVIRADKRLLVEDLVSVMDVMKNAGITKVGVVTRQEGGTGN